MKIRLSVAIAACAMYAATALATPPVAEVFLCKLNPGKTLADLDATVATWQKTFGADPALDRYGAAILTPVRANTPYDVIWIGTAPDLNGFAELVATIGPRSEAHFADVVTCESGLTFSERLYAGLPDEPADNEAMVDVYSCTMKEGRTVADLKGPHAAYLKAVEALKKRDPAFAALDFYALTPYLANTPADISYLSVGDDIRALAKADSAYLDSAEGQAADAAWNEVSTCESGLWKGQRVLRRRVE